MNFMHAAWYLRAQGVVVERSIVTSGLRRFYKVYDPKLDRPPVWMLPKAVCSLADLTRDENKTIGG